MRLMRGEGDGEDRGECRQRTVDQARHRRLRSREQERSSVAPVIPVVGLTDRGKYRCHATDAAPPDGPRSSCAESVFCLLSADADGSADTPRGVAGDIAMSAGHPKTVLT